MKQQTKIVGLMRFSLLTPTYYSETFKTLEETAAHLFAPQRMEFRFRVFENLVLPSLQAQSDQDFDLVVLTAQSMPLEYLKRLSLAISKMPNIHLHPVGPDKHYQLIKAGYDSVDVGAATHRLMFRLDDDDAVDNDYISRLRRTAEGLLSFQPPDVPQILSFNRGFYIRFGQPENEVFDSCERAPLSTGTALLAPVDYPRNPYRYNHRQLAQFYNTYSDISSPVFIRTIHDYNKSTPAQIGRTRQLDETEMARQLHQYFGLKLSDLRKL